MNSQVKYLMDLLVSVLADPNSSHSRILWAKENLRLLQKNFKDYVQVNILELQLLEKPEVIVNAKEKEETKFSENEEKG